MQKDYYTPNDLAPMLGVTPEAIQEWCRQGKIKASRLGKRWRISLAEGDRLIAAAKGENEVKKASGLALSY